MAKPNPVAMAAEILCASPEDRDVLTCLAILSLSIEDGQLVQRLVSRQPVGVVG